MRQTPNARLVRSRVPEGKHALNTHIGNQEWRFLRELARSEHMTVTMVVRMLIRSAMAQHESAQRIRHGV